MLHSLALWHVRKRLGYSSFHDGAFSPPRSRSTLLGSPSTLGPNFGHVPPLQDLPNPSRAQASIRPPKPQTPRATSRAQMPPYRSNRPTGSNFPSPGFSLLLPWVSCSHPPRADQGRRHHSHPTHGNPLQVEVEALVRRLSTMCFSVYSHNQNQRTLWFTGQVDTVFNITNRDSRTWSQPHPIQVLMAIRALREMKPMGKELHHITMGHQVIQIKI